MAESKPRYRTGKVSYIEVPAADEIGSAEFYERIFGWEMRRRGDGSLAFDDTVGEVSGTFVTGRPPGGPPGFLIHTVVADGRVALDAVVAGGGTIVREIDPDAGEVFAWFADPAGNILGVHQQPGLAETEQAAAEASRG